MRIPPNKALMILVSVQKQGKEIKVKRAHFSELVAII